MNQALETSRETAADAAFASYDFGSALTVTDSDGWTRDGVYWSRWVYGDDHETKRRFRLSFGCEFAPDTANVIETWAQA